MIQEVIAGANAFGGYHSAIIISNKNDWLS